MKKTILLTSALCAVLPLPAEGTPGLSITKGDTSITLYGVLDAGVSRVNHSLGFDPYNSASVNDTANKVATRSAVGLFNGGISPSRWGLKGGTGVGGDFRAIFQLESGLNLPNGTVSNGALGIAQVPATAAAPFNASDSAVSGQLFGRGAYFGVDSPRCGTLTIGRHQSLMLDLLPGYDALQLSQQFTPLGFSGSYGGGGATDNSRVDNSVRYKLSLGPVKIALLHKFGGASGDANARSAEQGSLGYEQGPLGIQLAYQGFKDATSLSYAGTAATPYALKATFFDTVCYLAAARYQVGPVAIKGGYQRQEFTNPSSPGLDQDATSIFGNPVISTSVTSYTGTRKKLDVWWLGAAWDVTPAFSAAVGYYQVGQNDFQVAAISASAANGSGKSRFGSVLLDYRCTPAFDLYAGFMTNSVTGGLGAGYTCTTNATEGLGARLSF